MKYIVPFAVASFALASPSAAALVVNPSTIGSRVIVNSTEDVIATFVFADADNTNQLFLEGRSGAIFNNKTSTIGSTVNLGSFAVGTELVFRLNVREAGTNIVRNYFTGPASRNPDNVPHAAASTTGGVTFVGFEDLFNGGDEDYNDLQFSFSNTAAAAVPEPASWAMMIGGFGLVGSAMRRRAVAVRFA